MTATDKLLAELLNTAEEQLRWLRAAAMPSVRETVAAALNTTKRRQAYELCDGEIMGKDIAAKVGVSKASITGWTQHWRNLGIAYENEEGRICHLISLDALELPLKVEERKED